MSCFCTGLGDYYIARCRAVSRRCRRTKTRPGRFIGGRAKEGLVVDRAGIIKLCVRLRSAGGTVETRWLNDVGVKPPSQHTDSTELNSIPLHRRRSTRPHRQSPVSASHDLLGRRRGVVVSGVRRMNEVNAHRARLVPERVTVFGRVFHLGM